MNKVLHTDGYMASIGYLGRIVKEFENVGIDDIEQVLRITLSEDQEEVRKNLSEFIADDSDKWCALLIGSVGNGKTMLASAAINSYNYENNYVYTLKRCAKYYTQADIYKMSRNFKEAEALDILTKANFLCIDELDCEWWTDSVKFVVQEVVQHFYNNRLTKKLLLVGNVTPEDLFGTKDKQGMFTKRMQDRIRDCYKHVMRDKSYRGKQ